MWPIAVEGHLVVLKSATNLTGNRMSNPDASIILNPKDMPVISCP